MTYLVLGLHELTIEDCSEAIRLNPSFAAPYNNRGNAYRALGQQELAIRDYEEATRLDPNDEGACHNLASALEHIDTNKALKAWGRYLQIAKTLPAGKGWVQNVLKIKKNSENMVS
jgi:tetratricopeptide (TPR) repeat protein